MLVSWYLVCHFDIWSMTPGLVADFVVALPCLAVSFRPARGAAGVLVRGLHPFHVVFCRKSRCCASLVRIPAYRSRNFSPFSTVILSPHPRPYCELPDRSARRKLSSSSIVRSLAWIPRVVGLPRRRLTRAAPPVVQPPPTTPTTRGIRRKNDAACVCYGCIRMEFRL